MNLSSIVSVILVLLTGYDSDLGEGIVVVDIYKAKEIKFFEAKDDKDPEHTIKLVNANREISIHPSTYERWLKPEDLWLDYSILNFRYIKQEGDWVEIVINKEIGLTKWINVNENVVSVP